MSVALATGLLLAAALALLVTRHRMSVLRGELAALRHAASRDPLTGLANRPGLTQAWTRHAPTRPHVAVIDLDGFKPVNDTHGHAAGDIVLTTIAQRLRTINGVASRLGGDEFAVLLHGNDPATAAHRLAAAIAAPIPLPTGATVTVTASIGLAPGVDDLPAALAAADAAMYRAKTTRTAVAMFDPHRDDHTTTATRPDVRVRDLTPAAPHGQHPAVSPLTLTNQAD
ncbi:GGDEF domain-containing protein [Micromonospora sp. ALFpr18c]|uniref:GGDEF domain-containing protein n=1 Tax=Micromonospora sp. ALFpr18c TaxID=1458665 RepID=UPI00124BA289|nr:GGDEF domain-containing protein [Micromonospora sp. ALFpr18c]KAB1946490.1 GGDEF domain-containing protein [Micromonospora sp. ALFpr18c]